jgi:CspA family cold shock protein
MATTHRHSGTVTEFDEHRGWGTVTDTAGTAWFFHCTQLADGSRTVAVGTAVTFDVAPRLPGRYEAVDVAPR